MINIYAELLFIENLVINYFILILTSKACGNESTKKRILLGAVVGALYAFIFFVPSIQFLYSTIMKILFSCAIVMISFPIKSIRQFIKLIISFYGVSFALGGVILAGIYFTDMSGLVKNNVFYIRELSYVKVLILALMGYMMMTYLTRFFKSRALKNELISTIHIQIDGKETSVKGIMDTANFLVDPISKIPVLVVEFAALEDFLPNVFKDILKDGIVLDEIPDNIYDLGWGKRIRFIPYTSLGSDNGMLVGIKPDAICVNKDNKKYYMKNIIIGIYNGTIGNEDYSALLHPDILKEEADYEIKKVWNG